MNRKVHLLLILGCILIAALDAPRAGKLLARGWTGPYASETAMLPRPLPAIPLPASPAPATAKDPATPPTEGLQPTARRSGS